MNLCGFKLVSSTFLTETVPVKNRPRVKKKNKRATRLYWRKQPKFRTVPSGELVQVGDMLIGHPATLARIVKEMERKS